MKVKRYLILFDMTVFLRLLSRTHVKVLSCSRRGRSATRSGRFVPMYRDSEIGTFETPSPLVLQISYFNHNKTSLENKHDRIPGYW